MKREHLRPERLDRDRSTDARNAAGFRQCAERNYLKQRVNDRSDNRNLQKAFIKPENAGLKRIDRPKKNYDGYQQIKQRDGRLMHRSVSQSRVNDTDRKQEKNEFTRQSRFDVFCDFISLRLS